jgi:hypothetical protein
MQTQSLLEKPKLVPFTLHFIQGIDQIMYKKAISESSEIKESYNPETQTSSIDVYAGTNLTYDSTCCNRLTGATVDDSKQTDT